MADEQHRPEMGEEGYLLLALVVACFLVLLALAVAAPRMAKELERDREVEAQHRGQEYVRAIQLYYRRTNSFPTSVEQLLGSGGSGSSFGPGSVRYLRQAYKDPLTRGGDFRMIHLGEAQTQVKGFFGEPLQGLTPGVPGSSPLGGPASGSPPASTSGAGAPSGGTGSSTGGFSLGGSSSGLGGTSSGIGSSGAGTTGTGSSGSIGSQDATTFTGSKGLIVGVGSNAKGHGLVEWNGSEDISQWEFLYDPRVELLKAKVSLFGGSPAATGSGSLGGGLQPAGGTNGGTSAPGGGASGAGTGGSGSGTTGNGAPGNGTPGSGGTTPTQ